MIQHDSRESVLIAIATYKRPHLLAELLRSLTAAELGDAHVVVVDNDAAGSAREVVADFRALDLEYCIESEPGIAEARNRSLQFFRPEDGYVAFIDDDERVDPDWLFELRKAAHRFSAEVVAGPVIAELPSTAPRWAEAGGFFDRKRHKTGTQLELAATNNSLVARRALEFLPWPVFDSSFSSTGGSDSDVFDRLRRNGARIVWCDTSLVREGVPASRISWKWVALRAARTGNIRARLALRDHSWPFVFCEGIARIGLGSARIARQVACFRQLDARALNTFCRGVGILQVLLGGSIEEYKRT